MVFLLLSKDYNNERLTPENSRWKGQKISIGFKIERREPENRKENPDGIKKRYDLLRH